MASLGACMEFLLDFGDFRKGVILTTLPPAWGPHFSPSPFIHFWDSYPLRLRLFCIYIQVYGILARYSMIVLYNYLHKLIKNLS